MFRETKFNASSGFFYLFVHIAVFAGALLLLFSTARQELPVPAMIAVGLIIITSISLAGFFIVNPGEAKALVLFGEYKGTVKDPGFYWANPFLSKKAISLRVRNFETTKLKVNDNHSNPIEIGAVVVWKVTDSAEALFEVDDYERYVTVQSESALRATASQFPYDAHAAGEESLSTHTTEVSHTLMGAIQDRLAKAGVTVVEARISHLAYAAEIAAAMLQRQQASAIIAARTKIVEGAVGMVENALDLLGKRGIVNLDEERKATMVSNLLVVLCSERSTQPVVNAGSLY